VLTSLTANIDYPSNSAKWKFVILEATPVEINSRCFRKLDFLSRIYQNIQAGDGKLITHSLTHSVALQP
jgi:hypothetical protein